jgi:hypothetical protein
MFLIASREMALSRCAAATIAIPPRREIDVLLLLARLILESERREEVSLVPGFDALQAGLRGATIPALLQSCGLHEEKARKMAQAMVRRKASILVGPALTVGPAARRNLAAAWNLAVATGGTLIPLAFEANARGVEALVRDHPPARPGTAARTVFLAGSGRGFTRAAESRLIVQDAFWTPAAEAADVVLPQAVFLETGGTLVNAEGRARRTPPVVAPAGDSRPGAAICEALASRINRKISSKTGREISEFIRLAAGAGEAGAFPAESGSGPRRFLPLPEEPPAGEPAGGEAVPDADAYKGLDLARDIKSLTIIRERTWPKS